MRRIGWVLLLAILLPVAAAGQETRGNINGIVRDSGGVVPAATVRITNTATSQTQQLVTNSSGYFEAVLLNPGTYEVRVELQGYKTLTQSGISLAVGQTVNLTLTLDVGQLAEEVTVVAQSALLDATTVSSGHNFDRQMVEGLPMFSNMPIMLSRFTPGVAPAEAEVQNIFQGYMEGTTSAAGGQVGTGSGFDSRNTGNNYTIDGATNNGFGRRIASSPNADQIEEMRVETSNFDASQGYGTGLSVSMMTRGGTNTLRGTANYTHWNNRLNSPNLQQKVAFEQRSAPGRCISRRPFAHRRVYGRRSDRRPEGVRRAPQGVLLRQLLEVGRLGAGAPRRELDRAGQPQAPRRGFLRLAAVAVWRRGDHARGPPPVPDFRPPDDAAGSAASGPGHPGSVPEQHHPAGPVHEPERLLQESSCSDCTRRWYRRRTRTSCRRRSSR